MLLLVKANTSINTAIFFCLCSKPLHEGADVLSVITAVLSQQQRAFTPFSSF